MKATQDELPLQETLSKPMDIMYSVGPDGSAVCTQVKLHSSSYGKHFVANYNKFLSHSARNMLARFLHATNFADGRSHTYRTRTTIHSVTRELRAIKKELAFVKRVRNHRMLVLNNATRNYQKDLKDLKKVLTRLNFNLLGEIESQEKYKDIRHF